MIQRIILTACLCTLLLAPLCHAAQTPAPAQLKRDAEIRAAVTAYVQQKTRGLGCEIRIRRISFSANPRLPEGVLEYEVMAPQQWEGWGAASLAVVARQKDRVISNIPVQVDVEALADMVVAIRQLGHGTIINGTDVAVQRRDIAAVAGRYTGKRDDIVGKRTRTTIKPNGVIRTDQVERCRW